MIFQEVQNRTSNLNLYKFKKIFNAYIAIALYE